MASPCRRVHHRPRLPATLPLVVVLCAVVCVGPTAGYGMAGREVDEFGRLPSLRFLHIPKTGTTFIITLRNYLTKCTVKDKTCSGSHGGTDPAYRFSGATPMWVEGCKGHLGACRKQRYHDPFNVHRPYNYVTLLRDPVKHAISGFSYTNELRRRQNDTAIDVAEYIHTFGNLHVKVRAGVTVGVTSPL